MLIQRIQLTVLGFGPRVEISSVYTASILTGIRVHPVFQLTLIKGDIFRYLVGAVRYLPDIKRMGYQAARKPIPETSRNMAMRSLMRT